MSLYKNEIYKTAEFVEKTRGEKQANINTINKLGPLATINTLSNIRKIISTPLVSSLKDIYKDKTALVASAGPSLAENIETIKKNREKFVLFAVGPSLKLLNKNGIEPDFLCIAEAMDTSAQIEDICLENINLIFEPFSNSYLWDLKTKNKFLYFSKDNFLDDWLANVLEINISNNKTIGTVSYLALSSAKTMGFKKIILCGQDLAFKDGKCYAIFIKHFENFAKENSELELINSSAGGAQIDGFINLPLDKVLNDCPVIEKMQIPVCTLSYNYKKIDDEIAKDKLERNPVDNNHIINASKGTHLCYDAVTGRYFYSDIEEIRKAVNDLNQTMLNENYVSLNDFHESIGLPPTELGDLLGWHVNYGLIDVTFSSQIAFNKEPCLVIMYTIAPGYNFDYEYLV